MLTSPATLMLGEKEPRQFFSEPHDLPFCPVPALADLPDAPPDVLDFLRRGLKNYDVEKPVIFVFMQFQGGDR